MGGLYKTMPLTLGLYMVGAFAISAVPLFSGFVSKSMVVSAAGESHHGGDLPLAHAGVVRDVPAHGPQASLLHVLRQGSRGIRARRSRPEHARRDGPGRGGVRAHRCIPDAAVLVPAVSRGLRAVHGAARHGHAGPPRLHGAGLLPAAQAPRSRAHHQPGHGLVLPQGRICRSGAGRGRAWRAPSVSWGRFPTW